MVKILRKGVPTPPHKFFRVVERTYINREQYIKQYIESSTYIQIIVPKEYPFQISTKSVAQLRFYEKGVLAPVPTLPLVGVGGGGLMGYIIDPSSGRTRHWPYTGQSQGSQIFKVFGDFHPFPSIFRSQPRRPIFLVW